MTEHHTLSKVSAKEARIGIIAHILIGYLDKAEDPRWAKLAPYILDTNNPRGTISLLNDVRKNYPDLYAQAKEINPRVDHLLDSLS